MTDKLIIIKDTNKPEMTLEQVINLSNEKKIDFVIGDFLDESVIDYYSQAVILRDTKRRKNLTDNILKDKLEIILKSIDKSLLNKPESKSYDKILSKYTLTSKSKRN